MPTEPGSEEIELIYALTNGIGPELGRKTRFAFFELRNRLSLKEKYIHLNPEGRKEVLDILSLAVFYSTVISPLESASAILTLAQTASASYIQIGRDKMTASLALQLGSCARHFKTILERHGIPITLLSFATLDSFLENVLMAKMRAEREALD